jgi:hypothetical protein
MLYLDVLAYMFSAMLYYLFAGYLLNVVVLKIPLKSITCGYPKFRTFKFQGIDLELGVLPISSSFNYADAYFEGAGGVKLAGIQLLNTGITFIFYAFWMFMGYISIAELADGVRFSLFLLDMDAFVVAYGPLDIWDIGTLMIGMVLIMLPFQLVIHFFKSLKLERIVGLFGLFVALGGILMLFRFLAALWGR